MEEMMVSDVRLFAHDEFGQIRTVQEDNQTWFIAKDVAVALGYVNPRDAIRNHVDDEDKGVANHDTLGGVQNVTIINESGLYSLILSSKLEQAKKFKRWVTSEVLPAIRQTGGYIKIEDTDNDELIMAKALQVGQRTIERYKKQLAEKEQQLLQAQPKIVFADAVSASKTSILIGELAKILKGNGVDIGQKRLFAYLRENKYLITRKGSEYNLPTQKAMNLGLFEIKETAITHSDGHVTISKTTKVTGKGQKYFINKLLNNNILA